MTAALAGCGGKEGPEPTGTGKKTDTATATADPTSKPTDSPRGPDYDFVYNILEGPNDQNNTYSEESSGSGVSQRQKAINYLSPEETNEEGWERELEEEYKENDGNYDEEEDFVESKRQEIGADHLENITDAYNRMADSEDGNSEVSNLVYDDVLGLFDFAQGYSGDDLDAPVEILDSTFASGNKKGLETVFAGYEASRKYDGQVADDLMAAGLKMVEKGSLETMVDKKVISDIELRHLGYELKDNVPDDPFENWSDTGVDNRTLLNLDENPQQVEENGLIDRMVTSDTQNNFQRFEIERDKENGETRVKISDGGERIGIEEGDERKGKDVSSLSTEEFRTWRENEYSRIKEMYQNPGGSKNWSGRTLDLHGTSRSDNETFEDEDLRKEVLAELGEFNLEYVAGFSDTVQDVNTVVLNDMPSESGEESVALERIAMINDFDQFWEECEGISFFKQTLGASEDLKKLDNEKGLNARKDYSDEFEASEIKGVRRFVDNYNFNPDEYSPSKNLDQLIQAAGGDDDDSDAGRSSSNRDDSNDSGGSNDGGNNDGGENEGDHSRSGGDGINA